MPTCPRCDGTDCRNSPWRSEDEKRQHRGEVAYRCMSCVHRFYGQPPKNRCSHNPIIAMVGGSTLVLMVMVMAIMWIWKS